MSVRHYDKDQVSVVVMGIPVTEFGEGDITIEFSEDDFTVKQGSHNAVMRAKKNNAIATVTVPIMQGSPSNSDMSTRVDLDNRTGYGAAQCQIKDLNGTSLFFAESSWCQKRPKLTFGSEPTDVEWVFQCAVAEQTVGFNRPVAV